MRRSEWRALHNCRDECQRGRHSESGTRPRQIMATSEKNLKKQGDAQKMREVVASYFGADSRVPGSRVCVNIPFNSAGQVVTAGWCRTKILSGRCCIANDEAFFAASVDLTSSVVAVGNWASQTRWDIPERDLTGSMTDGVHGSAESAASLLLARLGTP